MLVKQREAWKESFKQGYSPLLVREYEEQRNNESFRLSKAFEEVLEYCLYLEQRGDK